MGDVPSEKVNSIRGADRIPTAPEIDVSKSTPAPGIANASQPTQQAHANYPSSPAGFQAHGRYAPSSSMNMGNMAYALPSHQSPASPFEQQQHMHHYPTHAQGMVYPMSSMGHYPGQNPGAVPYGVPYPPTFTPYSMPQHPGAVQHGGSYAQFVSSPSLQNMNGHAPAYGTGYYQAGYNAPYGPGAHPVGIQMRQQGQQSRQGSRSSASRSPTKRDVDKQTTEAQYDVSKTIVDGSNPMKLAAGAANKPDSNSLTSAASSSPNPPRGPPRKPKQSGHALWVGNLPPGASVIELKDHFSQNATDDIESVFLISKSNCAFVNYKSAPACATALARFHDSRFQGVRLVCRLRKGFTAPGSGSTMGVGSPGSCLRSGETPNLPASAGVATAVETYPVTASRDDNSRSVDRYFIVKSLTVEDLELSKQSGIWATQTHNETNLNQAFETTEHVYLIFSANKSGEYFGYARMLSPISEDEELAMEIPVRPDPVPVVAEELDVTLTEATSSAPKGRIIDDSARGTIFWEVESVDDETDDARSERSVEGALEEGEAEGQSFGKPFRIQWLSTERVPFHRTRGLRNPWNANREVKIARDGTEIEPTIGRKLIQLFHLDSHP